MFYIISAYFAHSEKNLYYNNIELFTNLNECVHDVVERVGKFLSEIGIDYSSDIVDEQNYNISIIPLSNIPSYRELESRYNNANLQISKSGESWVDYKCNNIDDFTIANQYNIVYDKDGPHLKKSKYIMYGIYDGAASDCDLTEEEKKILS